MNRKEILKKEIEKKSSDPFNHYLLALEYQKENNPEAEKIFNYIYETFSDYLPNYYTFGKYLIDIEQEEHAEKILTEGIKLAQDLNNLKTEKELRQLLELYF